MRIINCLLNCDIVKLNTANKTEIFRDALLLALAEARKDIKTLTKRKFTYHDSLILHVFSQVLHQSYTGSEINHIPGENFCVDLVHVKSISTEPGKEISMLVDEPLAQEAILGMCRGGAFRWKEVRDSFSGFISGSGQGKSIEIVCLTQLWKFNGMPLSKLPFMMWLEEICRAHG